MERITYRITLDAHRNGIQRMLQGFETADIMARRIAINLVAGSDTFDLPMTNVVAMMYVTSPSLTTIQKCVIEENTIIYDVDPIVDEGIAEMQLKLIESTPTGARKVLIAPRFAVEVTKSNTDDEGAIQTPTFTALEDAVAKADAIYNSRILRVVIEEDCTFKVYYADGTVYENDYFREAMYNGNALLSQSYAVGGAGVREGEDTDNSKYYSNISRSASENVRLVHEESINTLNEIQKYSNYTYFDVNFETGELGYISTYCDFNINEETGQLETSKDETYTPEDVILSNAEGLLNEVTAKFSERVDENASDIAKLEKKVDEENLSINNRIDTVEAIAKGSTQALAFDTYLDMIRAVKETVTDWNVGQNIYIGIEDVPDLWVSGVSETFYSPTFMFDETVAEELAENGFIQVGNYVLQPLETEKVDLTEYARTRDVYVDLTNMQMNLEAKLFSKGDLAFVEGTLTNIVASEFGHYEATIPYPEGFNKDNCIVLGVMTKEILFGVWRTTFRNMTDMSAKLSLNPTINLRDDAMVMEIAITQNGTKDSISYRIVLFRFDNSVG